MLVVNDPEDAERILRTHVKKSVLYGGAFLGDGVLSTNKNDYWINQRKHLQEAFFPNSVFAHQVFPKSLARAKYAARELLAKQCRDGPPVVEINEFLLNEAMAQLQLALIGESQEFMDRTNKPIRTTFANIFTPEPELNAYLAKVSVCRREIHAWSNEVLANQPQGPLGKLLVTNCPAIDDAKMRRDAVSTFGFAGHDTTANLMTWCLYEVCQNAGIMNRLRAEIDAVYAMLDAERRDMQYADLQRLPYLSRVIAETLRLWPSVPNGTFRETEFDDVVKGRGGAMVRVEKGTQVNIPVWLLHTSPALWGPTAEVFDPDRQWQGEEIWRGQALAAWNPQSLRYMPFTGAPRDCIGKNFAHMEARVILCELLRHYDFALAEPTLSRAAKARRRTVDDFIVRHPCVTCCACRLTHRGRALRVRACRWAGQQHGHHVSQGRHLPARDAATRAAAAQAVNSRARAWVGGCFLINLWTSWLMSAGSALLFF